MFHFKLRCWGTTTHRLKLNSHLSVKDYKKPVHNLFWSILDNAYGIQLCMHTDNKLAERNQTIQRTTTLHSDVCSTFLGTSMQYDSILLTSSTSCPWTIQARRTKHQQCSCTESWRRFPNAKHGLDPTRQRAREREGERGRHMNSKMLLECAWCILMPHVFHPLFASSDILGMVWSQDLEGILC